MSIFPRKRTFLLSPFTFHLKRALLLLPFCVLLYSCSFNPAIQGNGEAYLQGEWRQDSVAGAAQLVTYSLSDIRFDCDSFFITTRTVSRVDYGADTCMNSGRWTEYMKGRYWQKNDTLHLKGFFHNADGSFKQTKSCLRVGVYEEFFKVKKSSDSLVHLASSAAGIPLNLRLIKRTTCAPKAM